MKQLVHLTKQWTNIWHVLVDVYTYLSALYQVGLDVTDEEDDAPSNDIFTAAQADAEKTIWMLQAERGQAPGIK